ncbi:ATP-dependent RNA helicase MAK5 [Ophiocordyceps camponoti-floridani]|uniref:RNA helicase n=1 Tax=Ophiocordyceps camponoti-floridani TaxID=2030778 RepID=A0A8H4QDU0_9HYPO|nr:ATP-dependent RNA helicase MAK5 [Ophiocordyceps camponoti-floridani]
MAKKRKPSGPLAPPAKRSKGQQEKGGKGQRKTAKQCILDAGSLPWRSFDDGGLEVVSGVEVVKSGGEVRFAVSEERMEDEEGEKVDLDDQSSFQGFSDGEDQVDAGAPDSKAASENDRRCSAAPDEQDDHDDGVEVSEWKGLKLSRRMLSAMAKLGFAQPTAIQKMAIPAVLAGQDIIGKAQTGSGKTLAFGIPMMESWLSSCQESQQQGQPDGPLALVLSPTRELAKQLGHHLRSLCTGLDLESGPRVCVVTGGLSVQKQLRQLDGADIIVATPGRLWELMEGDSRLQSWLARLRFLVVDEADRLLAEGRFAEVDDIVGALDGDHQRGGKKNRQTLVFSATLGFQLQTKLAGKARPKAGAEDKEDVVAYLKKSLGFRREPKLLDASPNNLMAEGLREGLVECCATEKDLYLYTMLLLHPSRRTLIFTNSISAVRRIHPLLQTLGIQSLPLHSQLAQKARLQAVERLASSPSAVMVATDVAARGLDIPRVDLVLHYHVPRAADVYIHRSGRTARANRGGVSVLLCSPDEVIPVRRLAAKVHEGGQRGKQHVIPLLPLDVTIAARLRHRVSLAKKIADAGLAKNKARSDDAWMRAAAEELGVDYEDDIETKKKSPLESFLSKPETAALRAELAAELGRRVNLGVSERYLAGGRVDVGALLADKQGIFLGGHGLDLGL